MKGELLKWARKESSSPQSENSEASGSTVADGRGPVELFKEGEDDMMLQELKQAAEKPTITMTKVIGGKEAQTKSRHDMPR